MLEKNSSKEIDVSEPDHFGTRETKDRSLCTTGVATDKLSLNLFSSAFFSASSACKRAPFTANYSLRANQLTNQIDTKGNLATGLNFSYVSISFNLY